MKRCHPQALTGGRSRTSPRAILVSARPRQIPEKVDEEGEEEKDSPGPSRQKPESDNPSVRERRRESTPDLPPRRSRKDPLQSDPQSLTEEEDPASPPLRKCEGPKVGGEGEAVPRGPKPLVVQDARESEDGVGSCYPSHLLPDERLEDRDDGAVSDGVEGLPEEVVPLAAPEVCDGDGGEGVVEEGRPLARVKGCGAVGGGEDDTDERREGAKPESRARLAHLHLGPKGDADEEVREEVGGDLETFEG